MSKFKLTQTAAEVQGILNNSLQKPTGLAKTKLVGVGVNGQENIEIGDNLTLANGKLSATGGGSARHCYMVVIDNMCFYEVFTAKDYDFEIGQSTQINNIEADEYKELYKPGYYPCGGYFDSGNRKILACTFQFIVKDTFKISGLDLKDPSQNTMFNMQTQLSFRTVKIVKQF